MSQVENSETQVAVDAQEQIIDKTPEVEAEEEDFLKDATACNIIDPTCDACQ